MKYNSPRFLVFGTLVLSLMTVGIDPCLVKGHSQTTQQQQLQRDASNSPSLKETWDYIQHNLVTHPPPKQRSTAIDRLGIVCCDYELFLQGSWDSPDLRLAYSRKRYSTKSTVNELDRLRILDIDPEKISLEPGAGEIIVIWIDCKSLSDCVSETSTQEFFDVERADYVRQSASFRLHVLLDGDREVGSRLVNALTHFVRLAQTKLKGNYDTSDPFANPPKKP